MNKILNLFDRLVWGVWVTVVILNALGVTQIPWSVAIVPMVMYAVVLGFMILGVFSNKEKISQAIKKNKKPINQSEGKL